MMFTETSVKKWLVVPMPRPQAKLALYCLPFAGGSSNSFRAWASLLPPAVELRAVELPGHGSRLTENLYRRIDDIIPPLAEAVAASADRPFALFGHSMGALLGYELVLKLQEMNAQIPIHVFLSGHGAPTLPEREEPIHQLPKPEFLAKIRQYNGTPHEVLENRELMELMEPILRADFEVCETYQPTAVRKIDAHLTAMGGISDPGAPRSDLEAWKDFTDKTFNVRMFPGDHFYLLQQKMTLLQAILQDINKHFNLNG